MSGWLERANLMILNTLYEKPTSKLITHVRGEHQRVIDYLMSGNETDWIDILDTEVCPEMVLASDHRPLRARLFSKHA